MKFHRAITGNQNSFTGSGPGWVEVNRRRFQASLIVLPEALVEDWAAGDVANLTLDAFAALAAHRPEVILLGTGTRQRFPPAALMRALLADGIGFEVMDTGAACRTYNILLSEGRRVAAAVIVE